MRLENAINETKKTGNTKDILEILWVSLENNFEKKYYTEKIKNLPKWEYFISDLDWTFFRWTLQKEAVSLFIKFVTKKEYYDINPEDFYEFIKDLEFFNKLEKKAHNKEIPFFEYLNAWIFLLLKHKKLANWEKFLIFVKNNFDSKEKVKPFRFSMKKIKEVLENNWNFLFVSWAPDFIFEIYLELLKSYIWKNIWENYSKKVFWFWTNIEKNENFCCPLWWKENKKLFIDSLKEKWIITKTIWWMWDTWSDFWISECLDNWNDFFFMNPEKKVIEKFEDLKTENINYKFIFERKDFAFEMDRKNINFII